MDGTIIFLFSAVLIVGGLIFALISYSSKSGRKQLDQDKYRQAWLTIEQGLQVNNVDSYQLVILNADKLLDQALIERGRKGQTMGERLKNSKDLFSNRNSVWEAHKLRNQIVHETNFKSSYEQTKKTLNGFKQALKDVGAI
jgi:hypothetical protein